MTTPMSLVSVRSIQWSTLSLLIEIYQKYKNMSALGFPQDSGQAAGTGTQARTAAWPGSQVPAGTHKAALATWAPYGPTVLWVPKCVFS